MKQRLLSGFLSIASFCLLLHLSVIPVDANTNPPDQQGIAFGFADTSGTCILITQEETLKDAAKYKYAIDKFGQQHEVEYLGIQKSGAEDNGRQTATNFDQAAGYLYHLKTGKINYEETIVLVTENFLSKHKPIEWLVPDRESLPMERKDAIYSTWTHQMDNYKCLARFEQGSIFILTFKPLGDSALATLLAMPGNRMLHRNYPAYYDETSTWRVDDGGDFGMDFYHVIALFEFEGKLEIVTDWVGAEGFSTEFMQESEDGLTSVKKAYRYAAPL